MKYFKCTVCGYIHEGEVPPAKCPVCNAPREKFEDMPEVEGKEAYESYKGKMSARWDTIMDKLGEIEKESGEKTPEKKEAAEPSHGFLLRLMAKNHSHPISVHFPNGILPVAVLFLMLSMFFDIAGMAEASFYNLVFVVLVMPGVIFSGYVDWQINMGGNMTRIIMTKIICGVAITIIGAALIVWTIIDPAVADPGSLTRYTYLLVHMLMLAVAGYAGHLGGGLVFND